MSSTQKKQQKELLPYTAISEDQHRAIDRLYDHDESILMLPVGFGKTMVAMTALDLLRAEGVFKRCLILAPLKTCQLTWAIEAGKWEHLDRWSKHAVVAIGQINEREALVESGAPIVVTNFENTKWILENYGDEFDAILVDELTKLKGGGVAFKQLRKRRKQFKWSAGMTGTLVEEGLEHLYYQFMVIDKGKTFGTRRDQFLMEYFTPIDYNQYRWRPQPGAMERIINLIKHKIFYVENYDGMPDPVIDYRFIDLPEEARDVYTRMKKDMLLEWEDRDSTVAPNAAVLSGKLQQIANGFVYNEDKSSVSLHHEKMSAVMEEFNGSPTIIVYTYLWELDRLLKIFPDAAVLGAGVNEKEAQRVYTDWNNGAVPVMLLHPKSGGHGLNFQYGGSRIIFMAPIWSLDQTDQVIGRLNRRGQTETVHVTFLVARETVEDRVMIPRVMGKEDAAGMFKRHLQES